MQHPYNLCVLCLTRAAHGIENDVIGASFSANFKPNVNIFIRFVKVSPTKLTIRCGFFKINFKGLFFNGPKVKKGHF